MNTKLETIEINAYIIGWNGMYDRASYIANEIINEVDSVHVVYSNINNTDENGVGNWIKVDNEMYFGAKFEKCLKNYRGGVFLLIHADAECDDWPKLISQCKKMNLLKNIGVWAPNTYHTGWVTEKVEIALDQKKNLSFVAQTDGIVFSLSQSIVERMVKLKYEKNNLGWGIDWAAICHSYCTNKLVIRDHNIFVAHKEGSGYKKYEAVDQMNLFLEQLSTQEKLMYSLLNRFAQTSSYKIKEKNND